MAEKAGRAKKPKSTRKKTGVKKPKYECSACGVMVTITEEGLGVARLMCCGQPMKKV
ncbi:MAG: hypothetical protein ACUVUU_07315 [bacterium]